MNEGCPAQPAPSAVGAEGAWVPSTQVEVGSGAQLLQQRSELLRAASVHPSPITPCVYSCSSCKEEYGEAQFASKVLQKENNHFLPGSLEGIA